MLKQTTTIPNGRADRLNHLLAEVHREIRDLYEVGVDVIEIADLGVPVDQLKDEVNRHRESEPAKDSDLFANSIVQIEGIAFRVSRHEGTTKIEAPCRCLGDPEARHDNIECPWEAQRQERVAETNERVEEMEERSHGQAE